jgi:hypothetical protein
VSNRTPDAVPARLTGEVQEAPFRVHGDGPAVGSTRFAIYADGGELLFALYGDGTVTCPNEARIPEAARMFWQEIRRLAARHPAIPPNPGHPGESWGPE